jgi:hypothetical protein
MDPLNDADRQEKDKWVMKPLSWED